MKKKLSIIAVVCVLLVSLSMVFTACGNTATETEANDAAQVVEDASEAVEEVTASDDVTSADETKADDAQKTEDTSAAKDDADSNEEVSFKLEIDPGDAGDAETLDCKAAGTLGEYLQTLEGCDWEKSQYGTFVKGFNGIANDDATSTYWLLYVNGEASEVGADEVNLEEGATYTWKYESFE